MNVAKHALITTAQKVTKEEPLTPKEATILLSFQTVEKENTVITYLKNWAVPLSLLFGFALAFFAQTLDPIIETLPAWTNMSPPLLNGVDYLWSILSNPIEKPNIVYHLPNIVLYSFGIVGIKHLIERLDRHTWLDKVLLAKTLLQERLNLGEVAWNLKEGHAVLFIGAGDFIAEQFVHSHVDENAITISERKPVYTHVWNRYDANAVYDDLKRAMIHAGGKNAGEYIFFPVKDSSVFLPGDADYDVSPHKLDIFCQNIRLIEREMQWRSKPIVIVGDQFHSSFVQSEHRTKVVPKSQDRISLLSIAKKYKNIRLLDPTDIVLRRIIALAKGRDIVFRATKEGIGQYKQRFYKRLRLLGYVPTRKKILTIGYDIFEDQTEQQTLARTVPDYYPVVLSKTVADALLRNGYKKDEFLYVPDLVLSAVAAEAAKQ